MEEYILGFCADARPFVSFRSSNAATFALRRNPSLISCDAGFQLGGSRLSAPFERVRNFSLTRLEETYRLQSYRQVVTRLWVSVYMQDLPVGRCNRRSLCLDVAQVWNGSSPLHLLNSRWVSLYVCIWVDLGCWCQRVWVNVALRFWYAQCGVNSV